MHRLHFLATRCARWVAASPLVLTAVSRTRAEELRPASKRDKGRPNTFDTTKKRDEATGAFQEGTDFLKGVMEDKDLNETDNKLPSKIETRGTRSFSNNVLTHFFAKDEEEGIHEEASSSSEGIVAIVTQMLTAQSDEQVVKSLIEKVQENVIKNGDEEDRNSFLEITKAMNEALKNVRQSLDGVFENLDLWSLTPIALFYYIELEDERKNPSWKRRMHRFQRSVDVNVVKDLNDAVHLSELSYANSVEEIQLGLQEAGLELIYFDVVSLPGKPSHFLALRKGQSFWKPYLEVVMVVRGTKSFTDMATDAMLEATDYRGGKAHAGILDSGKYLVEKHTRLLEELRKMSKKRYIKISLIGHSLGAGAASIAGIEFNDQDRINATVVGFGCPAMLSKELSESTKGFITTVIGDSDVVPRMSGAIITNVLCNIMENDYLGRAWRDLEHILAELSIPESGIRKIIDTMDYLYHSATEATIKPTTTERVEPILFPPGTCLHFYRDGHGIHGSIAPCTFFNDIDVTRRMIDDHYIDSGCRRILLDLMRQYNSDHYFRFDEHKE